MDHNVITTKAYEAIMFSGLNTLPIDPFKITSAGKYNILVVSYFDFAKLYGAEFLEVSDKLRDGLALMCGAHHFILYDSEAYEPRKRFTLFHEIGHIILGHKKQGKTEENEADFFAGQLIIPNALLNEIKKRGYSFDEKFMTENFNVSQASASNRMQFIRRYGIHSNEFDDIIVTQFMNFLNAKFPDRKANDPYAGYLDG